MSKASIKCVSSKDESFCLLYVLEKLGLADTNRFLRDVSIVEYGNSIMIQNNNNRKIYISLVDDPDYRNHFTISASQTMTFTGLKSSDLYIRS